MNDESEVRSRTLKVAEKVAMSFLGEYCSGPYADELSTDRVTFFYYNTDFEAGLNNALFWELKRLDLWQRISNKDWDDAVKLSMETAYKEYVSSQGNDSTYSVDIN